MDEYLAGLLVMLTIYLGWIVIGYKLDERENKKEATQFVAK